MLKKRWIALAGATVAATSIWSWAATSYQLQTKLSTSGGSLQVRNNAVQTVGGSVVYSNFTTNAPVPVTVSANPGYTIGTIYKNNVKQTVADPTIPFSTSFLRSTGTTQSLIASFVVSKYTVSTATTGDGFVSPSTQTVNYNSNLTLNATPSLTNSYVKNVSVDGSTFTKGAPDSTGKVAITLTGVKQPTTVNVEFGTVTANAGANKVAAVNTATTIYGSASGGDVAWTASGGTLANANTATPTFTAATPGTYTLTMTNSVDGRVMATSTTQVTIVASQYDAMSGACNTCHNPATGIAPDNSFQVWSSSTHKAKSVNCVTCHTDSNTRPHPTAANTCDNCHSQKVPFQASYHYNNHLETGSEFADPRTGINGVLNANESWTTTENGGATSCAYRCHFKPDMYPAGVTPPTAYFDAATGHATTYVSYTDTLNGKTYTRPGGGSCLACHDSHNPANTNYRTCLTCHTGSKHGKVPNEFWGSAHWNNHLEAGPEFANQTETVVQSGNVKDTGNKIAGVLNANDSYTTTEDGAAVTCAYRCHFRPGMGPDPTKRSTGGTSYTDTLNGVTHNRPTGDACLACHDSHGLEADYQNTCLTCHSGSKHGKVPNEFFASKHWQNNFEYGAEFANQMDVTVQGGNVKNNGGVIAGVLDANDSYTTTEDGKTVTCAYRCHFRPGMGPVKNVSGYLTNGKATTYVMYSSPYGAGKFYRPGGNSCMACHNAHGLEADARSTCYTCHTGGNHGWSVKAFEKSTHFTGTHAQGYPGAIGGPTGKACTACHNAHSLEAEFANMTTGTKLHTAGLSTGCQSCHTPGEDYSVFNADGTGKAGHFQTGTPDANGFYAAASYIQPATVSASCADCHSHNNSMNAAWAESGHGSTTSPAWVSNGSHTWLEQGGTQNFQSSPQSTNCIRCHSAQGFIQFVDSGFTNVNKVRNADGSAVKASSTLSCNACHSNVDKGTVRVGSMAGVGYKAYWGYSTAANASKKVVSSIQLPDNRNSNVCMPCHSQRASGDEIKQVFAAITPAGIAALGTAIYPHEAQPAAIWAGKGGYEFTVQNGSTNNGFAYQDRARHQRIGNYGTSGTGYNNTGITQGSCVGCHMTTADAHTMEIGAKDANGNFTSITSTECVKCHPNEFTYQTLNEKKAELKALVDALGNLLVKKGFTKDGINPLPERTSNFDMSLSTGDAVKAEKNTGAWFNWYLFKTADPGAYAHNPSYARRLLTDSIDWLDDNTLNSSAANTILEMGNAANGNYNPNVDTAKASAFTNDPGCLGCHSGATPNSTSAPGVETTPHFNLSGNLVAGTNYTQAQFVVPGSQCNNCHGYGHGTDSPGGTILGQYGESGHADINSPAWADYDFKNRTGGCVVCHNTAGFVKGVNTNFTDTNTTGAFGDTSKQVLGCNACHSSTAWKTSVRTPNVSSLGVVSPISYDSVGESNVCIPCHATRENTASVNAVADADYSNLSFKNPHYLGAAAVFYGKGGFQFYSSGVRYNTYGAAGKVGRNANWSHGKLGMDNYTTTTNAAVKASGVIYGSGNKGQCVACHLGSGNNHTFNATEVAKATFGTSTNTRGCYGCHTGTDMSMESFIEEEKVIWDRMMDFFSFTLKQVNLRYTEAYPYFQYERTENGVTAGATVKNWTFPATGPNGGTGKQTMGAALNFKLLAAEPGKHVHNRSFGRALIADSIVYLQKGAVGDRTVGSTDVNNIINFSNYSAANPVGNGVSISTLKSYLTRNSSGVYTRR